MTAPSSPSSVEETLAQLVESVQTLVVDFATLACKDKHNSGLLEHAHNLEHLLKEASRHCANIDSMTQEWRDEAARVSQALLARDEEIRELKSHIANLETRLAEVEKDLRQQEAAAYQYKQELQAFKKG